MSESTAPSAPKLPPEVVAYATSVATAMNQRALSALVNPASDHPTMCRAQGAVNAINEFLTYLQRGNQ